MTLYFSDSHLEYIYFTSRYISRFYYHIDIQKMKWSIFHLSISPKSIWIWSDAMLYQLSSWFFSFIKFIIYHLLSHYIKSRGTICSLLQACVKRISWEMSIFGVEYIQDLRLKIMHTQYCKTIITIKKNQSNTNLGPQMLCVTSGRYWFVSALLSVCCPGPWRINCYTQRLANRVWLVRWLSV